MLNEGGVRIFLSYGHDQNAPLVERIAADLRAAGHEVWIDTAEIKGGQDWRRSIVDGVLKSDWTLGFLSRHSTRDPGVCLDELTIALHVKGGNIATVLLEPEGVVRPPVSVSHIQWLDMHDWMKRQAKGGRAYKDWYRSKLRELLALLAHPATQRFAGEIEQLERRLKPVSQMADIDPLVEGFVGRKWLLDQLDDWRRTAKDARLFWLSGPPGSGKSAFAAWLAHHGKVNVIGLNLCRFNSDDRRYPSPVLRTLAFQIATRLPDYRRLLLHRIERQDPSDTELLRKSPLDLFNWLLSEPLASGLDGGRRTDRFLVVVDALDETIDDGHSALAEVLVECAPKLPPWIAFVVTSRPEPSLTRQFAGLQSQMITSNLDENLNDLRLYTSGWLQAAGQSSTEAGALIERIVTASEGNFLYLRTLRQAVDAKLLDISTATALPQGLVGLFERWFRRQFRSQQIYEAYVPLLQVLIAAEHAVPQDWLAAIFNWSKRKQAQMLEGLGSLFEMRPEGVAPFHKSLRDWLTDDRTAGGAFVVDAAEGTECLVCALWARFVQWIEGKEQAPLDAFCIAELPSQIERTPKQSIGRHLVVAEPWSDIWNGLAAVAESLTAGFAWESALAWRRMAALLADTRGQDGQLHRCYALRASGDILRTLGRSQEALATYREALVVARAHADPDPSNIEWRRNLYLAQIRVGSVLRTMGKLAGALTAYHEGLIIMRAISTTDRANAEWQRDVHVSLERVAEVLVAQGETKSALDTYNESLEIMTVLSTHDANNAGWRHDKSVILGNIGDLHMDRGDLEGALIAYRQSLDIVSLLSAQQPDNSAWRRELYASLVRVGDVLHAQHNLVDSLQTQRKGLDIIRALAASDAHNTRWRRDLSTSLAKVGDVLNAQGDSSRALVAYREGLDIMRALCRQDPSEAGWRRELSAILARLGDLLLAENKFEDALTAYRESLDIMRALSGMDPDNTQWHTDKVLSLWRLALIADDARARWSEALAILERLKSLDRLSTTQLEWIDAIKAKLSESEQPIGNAGNRRPRAAIRTDRGRRHVRPKRSIRR